jgi:hypothetical protein
VSLIHLRKLILVLLAYLNSIRVIICEITSQWDWSISSYKITGQGSCLLIFAEPLKVTESHSATANMTTQIFLKTKSVNYYAKPCSAHKFQFSVA